MSLSIAAASPEALAWIEERTGVVLTRIARGVMAVDSAGAIKGVVAFDGWTPALAHAHMAVEYPAVWRQLLPEAMHYVFNEANRELFLGWILASNQRALKFVKSVGFRELLLIRDGWAKGDDVVLLELRKADCRFLTREN